MATYFVVIFWHNSSLLFSTWDLAPWVNFIEVENWAPSNYARRLPPTFTPQKASQKLDVMLYTVRPTFMKSTPVVLKIFVFNRFSNFCRTKVCEVHVSTEKVCTQKLPLPPGNLFVGNNTVGICIPDKTRTVAEWFGIQIVRVVYLCFIFYCMQHVFWSDVMRGFEKNRGLVI